MSDETLLDENTWDGTRSEGPGSRIGPFTLIQRIGEGGFGDVYEAQQERPVRRKVALKIIKLGMDTRDVIARFAMERQALALMEHPHIARVLDAGATDTGRPYFVMELVDGEPITSYCDNLGLPIDARLRLFEQVCAAVQHAHTKGVIHRDLKPGNVLVTTHEGQPYAKVIDFGIAKATSGDLSERTRATRMDQVMGTALYMSPEQARGSADIDTRADIYSLGVILYELLTGATPVDRNKLNSVSLADTQRLIWETEPLVPSARLMKLAATAETTSAGFHANDPRAQARKIRGELDWIVMKALEKEPARRYETASAFAADIHRHLMGWPVLAAPPSTRYRLLKFVRRNKGPVAAGALIGLALLAGIVGFAWQARMAREQERIAQQRADELKKVSDFQAAMLGQIDPTVIGKTFSDDVLAKYAAALAKTPLPAAERARQTAAFASQWEHVNATDAATGVIDRTILKPAIVAIGRQFRQQPLVDAALRQALADSYGAIGLFDQAMVLQQQALATRRRELGDEHPDTLKSMEDLGSLLNAEGKSDVAEGVFRKLLAIRKRKLGENNPDTLAAIAGLGMTLDYEGKLDQAEPFARDGLDRRRRVLGSDNKLTIQSISSLASVLLDQGKSDAALPLLREALERNRRVLGEDDSQTVGAINDLGVGFMQAHRVPDAEPYFREAWEKHRRLQGEEHPDTLQSEGNLGGVLMTLGKLAQAEPVLRDAAERGSRVLGADHPTTLLAVATLGKVLVDEGKFAEAEKLLSGSETDARKVLSAASPPEFALFMMSLGKARTGVHAYAGAESALLEANGLYAKSPGEKNGVFPVACLHALADLYADWNRAEPGKGHDVKAAEWKKKLLAVEATIPRNEQHAASGK